MNRARQKKINKLLAWCNARLNYIMRASAKVGFPKSKRQAQDEMKGRKYPVGQWHRWYQVNKKYQRMTGQSLYRWQVR